MMRRREFITLLGGAAAAWPLAARAQQATMPIIGFLGAGSGSDSVWHIGLPPLCSGYVNLAGSRAAPLSIEYRWGEGQRRALCRSRGRVCCARKVDVIVTSGSRGAWRSRRATSAIPIVFATANEPIGSGLVASLARPGGNATGMSMQQTDLAGKRLELLREIVPGLRPPRNPDQCPQSGSRAGQGSGSGSGRDARARSPNRRNPTSGGDRANL